MAANPMGAGPPGRTERIFFTLLTAAAVAAAGAAVGWIVYAFALRVVFPMDLAWVESQMMDVAWRCVHRGAEVYGDPGGGWQSLIYTPLYFVVVGALGRVFGLDYWMGRSVSMAAFVAACAVVAWIVASHARRRREGILLALLAVGSVCADYPFTGYGVDRIRPDSLSILLVVGAAATLGAEATARRAVLSGLLFSACLYTKQSNLPFFVPLGAFALCRGRRTGLLFGLALSAGCLVPFVALELATGGWFGRWTSLASSTPMEPWKLPYYIGQALRCAPYAPLSLAVVPLMLARRKASPRTVLWWGLAVASIPATFLAIVRVGGGPNNLVPIVFTVPTAALLAFTDVLDGWPLAGWRRLGLTAAVAAPLCAYVMMLDVTMTRRLGPHDRPAAAARRLGPSDRQAAAAQRLDDLVASLDGRMLAPTHPFLVRRHHPDDPQLLATAYGEVYLAFCAPAGVAAHECFPSRALSEKGWEMSGYADVNRIRPEWLLLGDEDRWVAATGPYELYCLFSPPYDYYYDYAPAAVKYVYRRRHYKVLVPPHTCPL